MRMKCKECSDKEKCDKVFALGLSKFAVFKCGKETEEFLREKEPFMFEWNSGGDVIRKVGDGDG